MRAKQVHTNFQKACLLIHAVVTAICIHAVERATDALATDAVATRATDASAASCQRYATSAPPVDAAARVVDEALRTGLLAANCRRQGLPLAAEGLVAEEERAARLLAAHRQP